MRLLPTAVLLLLAPAAARDRSCTCAQGNASYRYLLCPRAPPADPDPCPAASSGTHPPRALPKPWNDACWQSPRMACFLRRHAASWGITCSLCLEKRCCPFANWRNCPECQGERKVHFDPLRADLGRELKWARAVGGKRIEMAISPEYVVVTDIPQLKIIKANGGRRIADRHELMHLYLQRASQARADWTKVFGPPRAGRTLMVLVRSEGTRRKFSQSLFGNPDMNLLYGGGAKLLSSLTQNGFVLTGRDDDSLHFNCRHMIGHLCVSTYHTPGVHEKHLPQWIFRGAGHWLCKIHPRARDHVFFCSYEGVEVTGSGRDWPMRARRLAARNPANDPVERMLQAATARQMDYDMHVRAWSWFDVFVREEPEPFVRFIQGLREALEARVASKQAFGQAPEYVDRRWREFVLGKRRKLAATERERLKEVDADAARVSERRQIAQETDFQLLAGRIRGLERCQKTSTARLLVSLLDARDSDRVRAVIGLVLDRTRDPKELAYMEGRGDERAGRLGRATLCRMFGEAGRREAVPLLRRELGGKFWPVRANAARALAQLGDEESIPALARMAASSPVGKVRVAAMDALAAFGERARETVPIFGGNLKHRAWQVRLVACETFRALGGTAAVDLLIDRVDVEGGRVHDEIRTTLKALTGVDRNWKARTWREWWKKARAFAEREKKMRAELEKEGRRPGGSGTDRYAKAPTYYGIKVFAKGVGYVLDTSLSMDQGFRVSEAMERQLGRRYAPGTRMSVSKQELAYSIRELDPRTRINVVFFSNRVRTWKSSPVPAGSHGEEAIAAVQRATPDGQTNYYDALRLTLGMR
ncbi:MAG: HEAT repeat domain-containing protein, partial [Planctomycetota bacterium]